MTYGHRTPDPGPPTGDRGKMTVGPRPIVARTGPSPVGGRADGDVVPIVPAPVGAGPSPTGVVLPHIPPPAGGGAAGSPPRHRRCRDRGSTGVRPSPYGGGTVPPPTGGGCPLVSGGGSEGE